jgi:hypothetical protein
LEAATVACLKAGLHYWSWLPFWVAGAIWFFELTPLDAALILATLAQSDFIMRLDIIPYITRSYGK